MNGLSYKDKVISIRILAQAAGPSRPVFWSCVLYRIHSVVRSRDPKLNRLYMADSRYSVGFLADFTNHLQRSSSSMRVEYNRDLHFPTQTVRDSFNNILRSLLLFSFNITFLLSERAKQTISPKLRIFEAKKFRLFEYVNVYDRDRDQTRGLILKNFRKQVIGHKVSFKFDRGLYC